MKKLMPFQELSCQLLEKESKHWSAT